MKGFIRSCAPVRAAVVVLALLALAGCAQQRIRDDSQTLLRAGAYEEAVGGLEAGLKEHPDSALLRAGLLSARAEAFARLLAEAASARASGRWDDAQKALERARPFDLEAPASTSCSVTWTCSAASAARSSRPRPLSPSSNPTPPAA